MLQPLVANGRELSIEELMRYSRHLLLPEIGVEGQQRLANSRVLIVGAGGLGSAVISYLAAAGVGTIGILDFDRVHESNLQRQVIHNQADISRSKVESAAAKVSAQNPFVNVIKHELRLDPTNVMDAFRDYDLIIDGTDNFATRYLINDAAVLLGKPYVWGSIYQFDGQASTFWSAHGPCYRCLHPEPPPPGSVPTCAEGGVLGSLCATIGSVQATEAIKLITGVGKSLLGELLIHNSLDGTFDKVKVIKNQECVLCGANPTQLQLLDNYEAFCGEVIS